MELPVPEVESEGLNEGLTVETEGLDEGLKSLLQVIKANPGVKAKHLSEKLENRPLKTVDRQIKTLVEKSLSKEKEVKRQVVTF